MVLPTLQGRYLASPVNYSLEQSDKTDSQSVAWVCQYNLIYFYDRSTNEWVDVSGQGLQITGWHYVIKKDGQPNKTQIDQLKSSLGWDGRSFASLVAEGWQSTQVQITVENEIGNDGKSRMRVQWIDAHDSDPMSGGGVKPIAPALLSSLDQRFGPMLRALGGSNGSAGAKPTPKPTTPTAADPVKASQRKAWDAYKAKYPNFPEDERKEGWLQLVNKFNPNVNSAQFTAADWDRLKLQIERPTQEEVLEPAGVFKDDDIPF